MCATRLYSHTLKNIKTKSEDYYDTYFYYIIPIYLKLVNNRIQLIHLKPLIANIFSKHLTNAFYNANKIKSS